MLANLSATFRQTTVLIFTLALLIYFGGRTASAVIVNGSITGSVTGFFESSETGVDAIFGFGPNTPFFGIPIAAAVGETVQINYQFDTLNSPAGQQFSPNAPTCVAISGRCTYTATRSPGDDFISASVLLNGVTFSLTDPDLLASLGTHASQLEVANQTNPFLPHQVYDSLGISIDGHASQEVAGVTRTVSSIFRSDLFRFSSEGLASDLSLTQAIDWDLARDGIGGPNTDNAASWNYRVNQSPSCCGNGANDRISTVDLFFEITAWQQSVSANSESDNSGTTRIPEPSAFALLSVGLIGIGIFARRRKEAM